MHLSAELATHLEAAHREASSGRHALTPQIRPATPHDLTELLVLERDTPTAPHWSAADYKAILQVAPAQVPHSSLRRHLLVAAGPAPAPATAETRTLIGFAVLRLLGDGLHAEAEIESVVVHPQARRQGLGTALCRALIGRAQAEGAHAVTLEVRARSTGAIHLYTGLGFITTGRRPDYYQHPPDDALLMHCHLQQSSQKPDRPPSPTGWLDV